MAMAPATSPLVSFSRPLCHDFDGDPFKTWSVSSTWPLKLLIKETIQVAVANDDQDLAGLLFRCLLNHHHHLLNIRRKSRKKTGNHPGIQWTLTVHILHSNCETRVEQREYNLLILFLDQLIRLIKQVYIS